MTMTTTMTTATVGGRRLVDITSRSHTRAVLDLASPADVESTPRQTIRRRILQVMTLEAAASTAKIPTRRGGGGEAARSRSDNEVRMLRPCVADDHIQLLALAEARSTA